MHNIDMDSIVEYAIEKIKSEIMNMRGSKIKAVDIDDINYNENNISFQVVGYNAAGKPVSEDYFSCSTNFEDAPAENEDDVKWLVDNNVPEFAYNFVKNPVRPSMREAVADYNIQYYQIFKNPEKPTDNGKMIAQAGTEDEAKAKGDKLVGKGNYLIKAVCDDGKVRDVDLHDYFNESVDGMNTYNITFYMDSLDDNVMSGPSTTKKIMASSKDEAEKKLRDECTDKYYIPTITDVELVEEVIRETLAPGDRVYVTVCNRQGHVLKLIGDDLVEVELDGFGPYPTRIDTFYTNEVEKIDMSPDFDDEVDYEDVDPDAVIDELENAPVYEETVMDEDLGNTVGVALFCTASVEVCTVGGVDEDGEDVEEPTIFDDKTPVNDILNAIDPDTDAGDAKCAEINKLLNAMPDGYIQVQAYCRGRDMGDRQVYDAYELYDEIRDIFNLDESLNESNNAYTYRGHYIINDGSTWMIKDGNNQVIRSGIATDAEAEEIIDDLAESVDYEDAFVADDDM